MPWTPAKPIERFDELEPLLNALRDRFDPEAIWLFGSRARGDNRPGSDWDLLVALADSAPPASFDPIVAWQIQHDLGIPATIVTATAGELADSRETVNTLAYAVAREGKLLHVRH